VIPYGQGCRAFLRLHEVGERLPIRFGCIRQNLVKQYAHIGIAVPARETASGSSFESPPQPMNFRIGFRQPLLAEKEISVSPGHLRRNR